MLGWFLMKPETSIEDINWLLARSAAFDAGYAFVTSYDALEKNGSTGQILAAIKRWEEARMNRVFNEQQKTLMEDVNNEFLLERKEDNTLLLTRVHPYRINHENIQRQPGEPVSSSMDFENFGDEQVVQFILSAKKCDVINPQIEFDGTKLTTIPVKINDGEHLKFDGQYAKVYSSSWQLLKSIVLNKDVLRIGPGQHSIEVRCEFMGIEGKMATELRIIGKKEIIK